MSTANLRPPYQVKVLEGTRMERVQVPITDEDGKFVLGAGSFKWEDKEIPNGFMVYLNSEQSVHFATEKELRAAGFDPAGPRTLIDTETGEHINLPEPQSLESRVKARGKVVRSKSQ